MHGNDVGVSLHDDRRLGFGHGRPGTIQAVQELGLVIHDRVRRVDVLGIRIVGHLWIDVIDLASPESNRVTSKIMDREQQPTPKEVVQTVPAPA